MSTAVDRAVEQLDLKLSPETAVFLDQRYFESYDKGYVLASIRAHLLRRGALLVPGRGAADTVVEARSGGVSINAKSDLLGIPSIPLPIPAGPQLETPEIAAYRREQQLGVAKLALIAMDAKSGRLLDEVGPVFGISWIDNWNVLGVGWRADGPIPSRALP